MHTCLENLKVVKCGVTNILNIVTCQEIAWETVFLIWIGLPTERGWNITDIPGLVVKRTGIALSRE